MPASLKPNQQWLRNKQLSDHFGVTTMALWRWKNNPTLNCPKSFEINGVEYNPLPEWEAWLRARAVANANAAASPLMRRAERLRGKEVIAADRAARSKSKAGSRGKA